jgi:hypothetical protein
MKKDARDGTSLDDLHPRAELCHVIGLMGLLCRRTKATHSFENRGHDGSPSL